MTTNTTNPNEDRLHELMADSVTGDITSSDAATLEGSVAHDPDLAERLLEMELAATSAHMAMLLDTDASDATTDDAPFTPRLAGTDPQTRPEGAASPWMVLAGIGWAAAAALLIAVLVQFAGTMQSNPASTPIVQARAAMLSDQSDAVKLEWGDWTLEGEGPEISGVTGDVVWSDAAQKGYMRFVGLPRNDPSELQYQLWIIDAERGMSQRISGGVFDADDSGELIVEIDDPEIPVSEAAAFALTIEKPGGVWVSDMSRRVVIAAK